MSAFTESNVKKWPQHNHHQSLKESVVRSKSTTPPFRKVLGLPPLHTYPLETLKGHLERNERMLKDSRILESLPDKGKKLIESNKMIKEAISIKSQSASSERKTTDKHHYMAHSSTSSLVSPEGLPLRSKPFYDSPISTKNRLSTLESQMVKLALSDSSFGYSTGSSNSSRQSLSSISSMSPSASETNLRPSSLAYNVKSRNSEIFSETQNHDKVGKNNKVIIPGKAKLVPLEESRRILQEQERRRQESVVRHNLRMQQNRSTSSQGSHSRSSNCSDRPRLFQDFVDDDSDDFDGFSEDEYY